MYVRTPPAAPPLCLPACLPAVTANTHTHPHTHTHAHTTLCTPTERAIRAGHALALAPATNRDHNKRTHSTAQACRKGGGGRGEGGGGTKRTSGRAGERAGGHLTELTRLTRLTRPHVGLGSSFHCPSALPALPALPACFPPWPASQPASRAPPSASRSPFSVSRSLSLSLDGLACPAHPPPPPAYR